MTILRKVFGESEEKRSSGVLNVHGQASVDNFRDNILENFGDNFPEIIEDNLGEKIW